MGDLSVGQVLWLKIRFNNDGLVSETRHPYLVIDIDWDVGVIEVAQMDSLEGKEFKAMRRSNKVIYNDNPPETVIRKDSFVQLDNLFQLEYFDDLLRFRRTADRLSEDKLNAVIGAYTNYHNRYHIDENKIVYMTREEIELMN